VVDEADAARRGAVPHLMQLRLGRPFRR